MKEALRYSILMISVLVLDQLTKWLVTYIEPLCITNFFLLAKTENRGISWGLLNGTDTRLFVLVTIIVSLLTAFLCVYAYRRQKEGYAIYGELLIIAGSVSNIIDRIIHGFVVDFIVVYLGQYDWPAFNFADCAIVIGVLIMFIQQILLPPRSDLSGA